MTSNPKWYGNGREIIRKTIYPYEYIYKNYSIPSTFSKMNFFWINMAKCSNLFPGKKSAVNISKKPRGSNYPLKYHFKLNFYSFKSRNILKRSAENRSKKPNRSLFLTLSPSHAHNQHINTDTNECLTKTLTRITQSTHNRSNTRSTLQLWITTYKHFNILLKIYSRYWNYKIDFKSIQWLNTKLKTDMAKI